MLGAGAGDRARGGAEHDYRVLSAWDDDGGPAVIGPDDPPRALELDAGRDSVPDSGAEVVLVGRVELDVAGPARAAPDASQMGVQPSRDLAKHEQVLGADLAGEIHQLA